MNFSTIFSFHFLLILLCLVSFSLADDVCTNKDCGEGHCVPDLLGLLFHCECNPGWKAVQMGPMIFSSCILPNCTVDFQCGNVAPPPPSPPPPPFNLTNPCNLVWCGDGNCMANGTGHYCQCYDSSANLFNNPAFVCLKQCYYEGDCNHFGLGPPPPPPPTSGSTSTSNGRNEEPYCLRKVPAVIIAVLTATFLTRS